MKRAARTLLAAVCALCACGEREKIEASEYPIAGLYTPGNTLGASDPTDMPAPEVGLGNRCAPLPGPAVPDASVGTEGELTLELQTQTRMGRYAPKNCSAIWIETLDGAYVATLKLTAALRRPGLVYWQDHACTEKLGPDAMTSATLKDHSRPQMAIWSGRDFDGNPVPDGMYKLYVEVTESDKEPGELEVFDLMKGPVPFSIEAPVAAEGFLVSLVLTWEPEL
jgi:hypothetical protein